MNTDSNLHQSCLKQGLSKGEMLSVMLIDYLLSFNTFRPHKLRIKSASVLQEHEEHIDQKSFKVHQLMFLGSNQNY